MHGKFTVLFLLLSVGPAWAASDKIAELRTALKQNIPAQQSKCEILSNAEKLVHPEIGPLKSSRGGMLLLNPNLLFGPAIPPEPPRAYYDAQSGVTVYVESDGRHVSAIDQQGKVLWVRNPFVENDMCPYRSAHPYISWIGAPGGSFGFTTEESFKPAPDEVANAQILKELNSAISSNKIFAARIEHPLDGDRFIQLTFNSSQQGYLNLRDGFYYFMGQN